MRPGYERILKNTAQEIEYLRDSIAELSQTKETKKLWKAWSGVLDHNAKAVSSLRRATDKGSSSAWSGKLLKLQKDDPILFYAYQARDSANHRFEEERKVRDNFVSYPGGIAIGGNSSVTIINPSQRGIDGSRMFFPSAKIETKNGLLVGGLDLKSFAIQHKHYLVLEPVTTRSRTFDVPEMDVPENLKAISVANHCADWLDARLKEAWYLEKREQ